jgi:septal ring factor EnvC (AmiA/AmiB activator)
VDPPKGGPAVFFAFGAGLHMSGIDLNNANLGDFKPRDVANTIVNTSTHYAEIFELLKKDLDLIDSRVTALEQQQEYSVEQKKAVTQTLTQMMHENKTSKDVYDLLEKQIDNEQGDRERRRGYLDKVLIAVLAFSAANMLLELLRAFRASGRRARSYLQDNVSTSSRQRQHVFKTTSAQRQKPST